MQSDFWVNQLFKFLMVYLFAYLAGLLVLHYNLRVNYTRKINHFVIFFLPHFLGKVMPFQQTTLTIMLGSLLSMASLASLIKPLRQRFAIIRTMFASYDRPEDRPLTLLWLSTQYLATFAVYVPLLLYLKTQGAGELAAIPILVNGLGDGLAEPVGIRFGRHTYAARALFTQKAYVRSLEGSACVFLASVLAVLIFQDLFTVPQFVACLLVLPVSMTLAEALAPHTWDSPFLFLVGGLVLILIITFL